MADDTGSADLQLHVLGPIECVGESGVLALGGPKQRCVLAVLAASTRPVRTGTLIEALYGLDAEPGARRTIATYMWNLRQVVGDVILREGDGYLLAPSVQVDGRRFEALLDTGRHHLRDDPERASVTLREALALWRGHAYQDIEAHLVIEAEIARLHELRIEALEARVDADLRMGLHRELIPELEALAAEHPFRESFRASHMLALYRCGRQRDALRAFAVTRNMLVEELGTEPSPVLVDLELQILEHDPRLRPPEGTTIRRCTVLAVELDPAISAVPAADLMEHRDTLLASVAGDSSDWDVRGLTGFVCLDSPHHAVEVALSLTDAPFRIAIDHGLVESVDGARTGPTVSRALRLAATAHPGQILLTGEAHAELAEGPGTGWSAMALGSVPLAGLDTGMRVFQLTTPGGAAGFPPLDLDRRPPPPRRDAHASIAGYEIRHQLGPGAIGSVYLAYQASLGRQVAVRLFPTELIGRLGFIARFEAAAHLVASVEHPALVPLVDYWRRPDQAAVVHRLLPGGTLRTRAAGTPGHLLMAIGEALAAAHRGKVVHGRVRPDNVLFDDGGRPYLADLGIGMMVGEALVYPADAYAAPETIGSPPTVAGDIYSLGVLVAHVLAGEPESADGALPELGGTLDDIVARATAPAPDDRYESIEDMVDELGTALGSSPSGSPRRVTARNPYKGLAAFEEADADDYYGRRETLGRLLESVSSRGFTLVVGPSGVGKSSLIKAGLVPAVRSGSISGSAEWLVTEMVPSDRPFDQLESALSRVSVGPVAEVVADMRAGRCTLGAAIERLLPEGGSLLLAIDQFEEVFTHVQDEGTRQTFLGLFGTGTEQVRVVATLRADFFDRPLAYARFGELVVAGQVAVHAPSPTELSAMVVEPAALVGVRVEDALCDVILADAEGQPGVLPLVEHVLTELFDERQDNQLTLADYRRLGGLAGSVGRRAEAIFAGLSTAEQAAAQQVWLRLVTVDEDHEDTRRRVRRAELERIPVAAGAVSRVLEAFGDHRLLFFDRDQTTRGPTVEVAHEAVLRRWDRLRGWVDDARDDLLFRRRLERAAQEWEGSDRDASFLLSGSRLARAEGWRSNTRLQLTGVESAFLDESRRVADTLAARSQRVRRRVMAALALAAVVSTMAAMLAQRQSILNRVSRLAAEAVAAIDEDPNLAIGLALEAHRQSQRFWLEVPGEVVAALQTTVQASRMVAILHGAPAMVAFHPDGETVLVADANRRSEVILVDIESGQEVGRFDAGETVGDIAVSPDGSTIAVTYWDRSLMLDRAGSIPAGRLFDSSTHEERAVLEGSCCVRNPEFNTDGSMLAASGATRFAVGGAADAGGRYTQRVWDLPTGSTVWSGTDPLALLGWFDADTVVVERVYLGAGTGERTAEIGLVDVDGGEPVFVDLGGTQLTSIDVGRDVIAATREDGTVDVWSRDLTEPFASFQSAGGQVVVSHDERLLIVLSTGGEIEVIDLASGRRSQLGRHASALLAGESGGQAASSTTRVPVAERNALVETLARAGGGDLFAISVGDGSTVVWDLSLDGPDVLGNHDPGGLIVSGASSAGGDHIALLIDGPNGVSGRVVDLATGDTRVSSSAAAHGVLAAGGGAFAFGDGRTPPAGVEFLGDGSVLALTECDRPVAIDDPGEWLLVGGGFCPDMGGRLIDLTTGDEVGAWPQSEWIDSAAFGRHGTISEGLVAVNVNSRTIEILRYPSLEEVGSYRGARPLLVDPRFSEDGRYLSLGDGSVGTVVVDVAAVLEGAEISDAVVASLVVSGGEPQGAEITDELAVTSHNPELRLWDLASGDEWLSLRRGLDRAAAVMTAEGRHLYYQDTDGVLRRFPLNIDELVALAESRMLRPLTAAECRRFLDYADCTEEGLTGF